MVSSPLPALAAPHFEPARTAWLLTFIDLTGILVGFFVLLYSTSTISSQTWQTVSGSFQAAFEAHDQPNVVTPLQTGQNNALFVTPLRPSSLGYLHSLLQQRLLADKAQMPLWREFQPVQAPNADSLEMRYRIPPALLPGAADTAAFKAGWGTLTAVVRTWKNPLYVRVSVPATGDVKSRTEALQVGFKLWQFLQQTGLPTVGLQLERQPPLTQAETSLVVGVTLP